MNWSDYFFNLIENVAKKSKDPSTKVGCIITTKDNIIKTTGYNGFARKVREDLPERWERPTKYLYVCHGEANAISNAARLGIALQDCVLYIGWIPCHECAKLIIQSGISEVIVNGDSPEYNNEELKKRWKEQMELSRTMFEESGVKLTIYNKEKTNDI